MKQLEAARKRVERTLKTLREGGSRETEGAVFENIGFDMLVVDEAHYYKNLAVVGRSVAGMSSTTSAKCENLVDICDYLREQGKGSNIVFATGTPVSNTMSELYNMQRYLAPELLRSQGVYYFSDWAQTYGQTVQSVEVKPESNGFQIKERFAKFHNLPELMASVHTFGDIMTKDDLDLDVPEVEVEVVAVEGAGRAARRPRRAHPPGRRGPRRGQPPEDNVRGPSARALPQDPRRHKGLGGRVRLGGRQAQGVRGEHREGLDGHGGGPRNAARLLRRIDPVSGRMERLRRDKGAAHRSGNPRIADRLRP